MTTDRLLFNERLRWLPADIAAANPRILTGVWTCPDYRPGDKLVATVGQSSILCSLRRIDGLAEGGAVFRFFVSVKTKRGWKLIRIHRETGAGRRSQIAKRLVWMPPRVNRQAMRAYAAARDRREAELAGLPAPGSGPLISVLMPVFDPPLEYLRKAIDSLRAQTYGNWELCMADDASRAPGVRDFLRDQAAADSRVKVVFRPENGHISEASNSALSLASGSWCALLDQDDELSPHAFAAFVRALRVRPEARLFYSDEDKIDVDGRRHDAYHKPDWMPELLLGQNFVSHLGFYRTDRLRGIGGFRRGYEGCQDWDLVLRFTQDLPPAQIVHIPFVLYHWRTVKGSTACATTAKPYVAAAARRTVDDALKARDHQAEVSMFGAGQFRLALGPKERPRVEIVDLSAAPGTAVDRRRIAALTDYPELSFSCAPSGAPLARLLHAADQSDADILVAFSADLVPVHADWLRRLVGALAVPGVAAAGGHVVDPTSRVIGGALMLDSAGRARPAFRGLLESDVGYLGRNRLVSNPGGLGLLGMAFRRAGLPGAADRMTATAHEDVCSAGWALCARWRAAGFRVVHDPGVVLEMQCVPPAVPDADLHRFDGNDPSLHRTFGGCWPDF